MSELPSTLKNQISIEDELKTSYLDYAMSVIVGRALPDVRDGLKPVHRRVLYAMNVLNNDWNKAHKKSARIMGDVIGKYHPHGDTAVYDTIVRMAQPFSLRYLLVDGQGNFGSVDGDAPAAMRYTEIRMTRMAHGMLNDIEKETVNFLPNYDGTEMIPEVLPCRFPNLLVNGSSGIAVGMATNIPPHNLGEVIDALLALLENSDLDIRQLMEHIPGPDFPTAGIINGRAGIVKAYLTGRGKLQLRAKATIEVNERTNRSSIIVHELPYQVNKARLLEKIGELVRDKKVSSISALRDESDKQGMRMVIELKRGENAEVLLNNLYSMTQMQTVFGINMVALDHGQPRTFNLKQMLQAFIAHRREVITRRSEFELKKARARTHLLEGLAVAIANIDAIVALIKAAPSPAEAKHGLMTQLWAAQQVVGLLERADTAQIRPLGLAPELGLQADGYRLSAEQAQAILELRLHRLTGLEQDKINSEYKQLVAEIARLLGILASQQVLDAVIKDSLLEEKQQYGDARRTQIMDNQEELTHEDLIDEQEVVITLSKAGYVKSQALDQYQAQHRGGRGKAATKMKEEDYVNNLLVANTHDTILCFSSAGKVYWLKGYQLPQAARTARGRPIINLLPLAEGEVITAILPISEFVAERYVVMVTAHATIKKVSLDHFAKRRSSGLIAVDLVDDDALIGVAITDGTQDIMLLANSGKAIRFTETAVRAMGRTARGVRGMKLAAGQRIISLVIPQSGHTILTATENGYGQRTEIEAYRPIGRGGQGVIAIQTSERNGQVIAAVQVAPEDEALLISDGGTLVRIPVAEISVVGRNTQGVRLIQLSSGEQLVGLEAIDAALLQQETPVLDDVAADDMAAEEV